MQHPVVIGACPQRHRSVIHPHEVPPTAHPVCTICYGPVIATHVATCTCTDYNEPTTEGATDVQ